MDDDIPEEIIHTHDIPEEKGRLIHNIDDLKKGKRYIFVWGEENQYTHIGKYFGIYRHNPLLRVFKDVRELNGDFVGIPYTLLRSGQIFQLKKKDDNSDAAGVRRTRRKKGKKISNKRKGTNKRRYR
jgi:hypothetical protein